MLIIANCLQRRSGSLKKLVVMKLMTILIFCTCLQASAKGLSQNITLTERNVSLKKALKEIKKQTGYDFFAETKLLEKSHKVDIDVKNASIVEVLDACFKDQPLTYEIFSNTIVVREKKEGIPQELYLPSQAPIEGVVRDSAGRFISGVSVQIRGKSTGTVTDENGHFSINASEGDVLVVSHVGYKKQEEKVTTARKEINIILMAIPPELDQVVVVGYGTQKKSSLTASIATVQGSDIAEQPVGDLSNALGGRASGVLFTQSSGQVGNDAATILIRGIGTNGSTTPLYIVDGIPRSFGQINPADVESISVLKDAAAVAPYGMGGANGVILVTTKKGKLGKPVLSYDGYAGFQSPTVVTKLVSSYQYALMKNAASINDGNPPLFDQYAIEKYRDGSDPDAYPNANAFKDIYKKNVLQTSHSLALRGGTDKVRYYMSLGYLYQDGVLPVLNYSRYNLTSNLEVQATSSTKVSLSLNGRVEQRHFPGAGTDATLLFPAIMDNKPINPVRFSNGDPTQTWASYHNSGTYQNLLSNTLLSQFSIEQQLPVKGLSAKFVGAFDFNPVFSRYWSQPNSYYTIDTAAHPHTFTEVLPTTLPNFSESYNQTQAFNYQGYINYGNNFGKSAITGLVVFEYRNTKYSAFNAGRINYQVPIPELFAGGPAATDDYNNGNSSATKQNSIVYRVTYGFDGKYLFEASGRYDGHYYFAPNDRFGFFPSFSAAWRLSEESFMKGIGWINNLKIRGSWGETGALAGAPFQYLSAYSLYGGSAVLNGTGTQGLYENSQANPNITWERAKKSDIGVEAGFLKGQLNIEADYFYEKRSNMLIYPNVTVPVEYGIGLSQVNAGVMSNRGFEFSIDAKRSLSKDFTVGFNGNFSYARNRLIQIFETASTYDVPGRRQTGRPLNQQFGYQAIGYFKTSDFDANGNLDPKIATQPWGTVHPGDIRYEDVNKNNQIDVDDQVPLGDPTYPSIVYGFSPSVTYKGFEFSLLFQGAAKKSIQLGYDAVWPFFNGNSAPITAADYWTPENPNAPNPRITSSPSNNNTQMSSFWQRNTSYLRLRTGTLSYNIRPSLLKHSGMSSARIYLSCQNLFTWSPLKNFDPEISSNRGWYFGTQKAVTAGINLQF